MRGELSTSLLGPPFVSISPPREKKSKPRPGHCLGGHRQAESRDPYCSLTGDASARWRTAQGIGAGSMPGGCDNGWDFGLRFCLHRGEIPFLHWHPVRTSLEMGAILGKQGRPLEAPGPRRNPACDQLH